MRIVVSDETGERFSYDTAKKTMCLMPGNDEKPAVIDAMDEALTFLRGTPPRGHHVLGAADLSAPPGKLK